MQEPQLQFDAFSKPIGLREAFRSRSLLDRTAQNIVLGLLTAFAVMFFFIGLLIFLAVGVASIPFVLLFSLGPTLAFTANRQSNKFSNS